VVNIDTPIDLCVERVAGRRAAALRRQEQLLKDGASQEEIDAAAPRQEDDPEIHLERVKIHDANWEWILGVYKTRGTTFRNISGVGDKQHIHRSLVEAIGIYV
jgi:adenylate kinase family enzyme